MEFLIYCFSIFFVAYMLKYASIFDRLRAAAMPALPGWLQTLLSCSFCLAFWITAALSLFTGFTPMILAAPPCVLLIDLTYRKLAGESSDKFPEDFSEKFGSDIQSAVRKEIEKQSRADGFLSSEQSTADNHPSILK